MSRAARLVVPNLAHHIVHRAYNREPIFVTDEDYQVYLAKLDECRKSFGCKVYAFCVMLNHVHLLVDPGNDVATLARFMKCLAERQMQHLRKSEKRNGPVWEGRFRSSPVADDFLLPCARYIELNPVRSLLVKLPENYAWSSVRPRLGLSRAPIDLDAGFLSLGQTSKERNRNYKSYLRQSVSFDEWATIRRAIQNADLTGGEHFRATIASYFGTEVLRRPRGRPRKIASVAA